MRLALLLLTLCVLGYTSDDNSRICEDGYGRWERRKSLSLFVSYIYFHIYSGNRSAQSGKKQASNANCWDDFQKAWKIGIIAAQLSFQEEPRTCVLVGGVKLKEVVFPIPPTRFLPSWSFSWLCLLKKIRNAINDAHFFSSSSRNRQPVAWTIAASDVKATRHASHSSKGLFIALRRRKIRQTSVALRMSVLKNRYLLSQENIRIVLLSGQHLFWELSVVD